MISLFYPNIADNSIDFVKETLSSKYIAQGPKVLEFERRFNNIVLNRKYYSVMMNSTTAALHIAYILSDITEGDEVICPVLTCTATNLPLLYLKAKPVFADIDKNTLSISPEDVERKITQKTKAIICLPYGGYPCEFDKLRQIADKYGLKLICDNAHGGIKMLYNDKSVYDWCDYTIHSFQAIKILTCGDGGALIVKNEDDEIKAKRLRWFGINKEEKYNGTWNGDITEIGYKYHMNDISATIGIASLLASEHTIAHYRELAKQYMIQLARIGVDVYISNPIKSSIDCPWLLNIKIDNAQKLKQYLRDNGIESDIVHERNDKYTIFGGKRLDLPNMNSIENKYLALPMNKCINDDVIDYIVDIISKYC